MQTLVSNKLARVIRVFLGTTQLCTQIYFMLKSHETHIELLATIFHFIHLHLPIQLRLQLYTPCVYHFPCIHLYMLGISNDTMVYSF